MMNETRRKPTTGRQSPSLFDKWHGIFYMPSRIDEAGHTKAFDYPVAEHWGESQRTKRSLVGFEPTSAHTYESEIQRSTKRWKWRPQQWHKEYHKEYQHSSNQTKIWYDQEGQLRLNFVGDEIVWSVFLYFLNPTAKHKWTKK